MQKRSERPGRRSALTRDDLMLAGAASAAGFVLLIGLDFFRAIGTRLRVRGVVPGTGGLRDLGSVEKAQGGAIFFFFFFNL